VLASSSAGFSTPGTDSLAFLAAMQRAHPGVPKAVDAIGYHPYQENLAVILQRIAALRRLLSRDGARGVPIEITEIDANDNLVSAASWSQAIAASIQPSPRHRAATSAASSRTWPGPPATRMPTPAAGSRFSRETALSTPPASPTLISMHRAVSHIATRRKSLCT
jgi:hypothetical protein